MLTPAGKPYTEIDDAFRNCLPFQAGTITINVAHPRAFSITNGHLSLELLPKEIQERVLFHRLLTMFDKLIREWKFLKKEELKWLAVEGERANRMDGCRA